MSLTSTASSSLIVPHFSNLIEKFWRIMSNSFVAHDYTLKMHSIDIVLCDNFFDGVYIPKDNKVRIIRQIITLDHFMCEHIDEEVGL